MFNRTTSQQGFTLIELLVVVAIIGILSAVVIASLQDARLDARNSAMKLQARNLAVILELERNEYGRFLNHDVGAAGDGAVMGNEPGFDTCADREWLGSRAEELESICNRIVDQAGYIFSDILAVTTAPAFRDGNHFSIMVQLNGGDWYCIGSNGGTYEGPIDPGTGPLTGSGCYYNP